MAALAAVLRLVGAGKGVVAGDDLYGGTSRLLAQVAPNLGIDVTNVDTTNIKYATVCHAQPAWGSTAVLASPSVLKAELTQSGLV